jgi:hypothetical protein
MWPLTRGLVDAEETHPRFIAGRWARTEPKPATEVAGWFAINNEIRRLKVLPTSASLRGQRM